MNERKKPEDLLEFPCHYTFKAVGDGNACFVTQIIAAVRRHAAVSQDAVHVRPSSKGNYQSVSVIVQLQNFTQLEDIYAAMKEVAGLKLLL